MKIKVSVRVVSHQMLQTRCLSMIGWGKKISIKLFAKRTSIDSLTGSNFVVTVNKILVLKKIYYCTQEMYRITHQIKIE